MIWKTNFISQTLPSALTAALQSPMEAREIILLFSVVRKLMPRKVYDSSKDLYPWFSFLSLGLTWNKSRIHHSKKEFKYAKYLKWLPRDCWCGSLPLSLLYYIYRWQTTKKTEKPKCRPNRRKMCSRWFQFHLTFRSSEAEQKSKHVP